MTVDELMDLLKMAHHLAEVRVAMLGEEIVEHEVFGIRTTLVLPDPSDCDWPGVVWIAISDEGRLLPDIDAQ